ncbi:MAG: hypothetical protein LBF25_01920 [Puniceicoccales bacterium]|nr:hypothetical protein [Puniceicoccales bacterium]
MSMLIIHQFATNPAVASFQNPCPPSPPSQSSSDDDDDEFLPGTAPCHSFGTGKGWHAIPLTPEARRYYERIVQSCGLRLRTPSNHIDHRS